MTDELGDDGFFPLDKVSNFAEFAVWLETALPELYRCKPREKLVIVGGSVRILDVKRFVERNAYSSGRGWRLIIEYSIRSTGRRNPIFEASVLERIGIDVIAGGGTKFVSVLCFIPEKVLPKIAMVERLRQ